MTLFDIILIFNTYIYWIFNKDIFEKNILIRL